MKQALKNFSTDLLRISYWIYQGRNDLANKFINFSKRKYANIPRKIGCYENIWDEIEKIQKRDGGKDKAAERASTASIILLHNSQLKQLQV